MRATTFLGFMVVIALGIQGCTQRHIAGTDVPIAYWHDEIPECRYGSSTSQAELKSQYPDLRWLNSTGKTVTTPFEIGRDVPGTCVYFSEDETSEVAGFYESKLREFGWELVAGLANVGRYRKESKCLTFAAGDLQGWLKNYAWNIEYEDESGATMRKKISLISGDFPAGSLVFVFWVNEINEPDDCSV